MTFSQALELIKNGSRVQRDNWNGKGQYLALQTPDQMSKMKRPYIYIRTVTGDRIPWVASQSDLLEDDWIEISPELPSAS
jgi:hypothetical protein